MTTPVLASPLSTPMPRPLKKRRVLLVDTSATKRDLRAETMRKLGMEVDCAADISEARSWWRSDLYNLVIISAARGRLRRCLLGCHPATSGSCSLPSPWPEGWLGPNSTAAVLRFVDTRFNPDSTPAEVRRAFPSVRGVSINPMPLRAIFVSLAKDARKAA